MAKCLRTEESVINLAGQIIMFSESFPKKACHSSLSRGIRDEETERFCLLNIQDTLLFSTRTLFYKNIEAEICEILRIFYE